MGGGGKEGTSPQKRQPPEKLVTTQISRPMIKQLKSIRVFQISDIVFDKSQPSDLSGTYGTILFGTYGSIPIVLKKYKDALVNPTCVKDKMVEILILQHLNQYPEAKVVKFYGTCLVKDYLYLVLERLDKNLDQVIKTELDQQHLTHIFYRLLQAVDSIHCLGFVHNDLKLGNIMVNQKDFSSLKLIDFGLSKFVGLGPVHHLVNRFQVTQVVKAPDERGMSQYLPGNRLTYSSDMYSVGASMVHLIIHGYSVFEVNPPARTINSQTKPSHNYTPLIEKKIGSEGLDLLLKIMNPDAHQRWCARQALRHPFFTGMNGGGAGDVILHHRMGTAIVHYTHDEWLSRSMDLCYMEEIHRNYQDDLIPVVDVPNVTMYKNLVGWIMSVWDLPSHDIFTIYDSIINTLLMLRRFVHDEDVHRVSAHTFLINEIYSDLCDYYHQTYSDFAIMSEMSVDDIYHLLQTELLSQIDWIFIPIWCHIIYIGLKLELTKNFISDVGKWVLFYFIQPKPFPQIITSWDLVRFVALNQMNLTNKQTQLEWLQIDPVLYKSLQTYYSRRLVIGKDKFLRNPILSKLYWGDGVPP
jgi:serine/threonine protein kinase